MTTCLKSSFDFECEFKSISQGKNNNILCIAYNFNAQTQGNKEKIGKIEVFFYKNKFSRTKFTLHRAKKSIFDENEEILAEIIQKAIKCTTKHAKQIILELYR